jgi:MATE family multidrug resistance protein
MRIYTVVGRTMGTLRREAAAFLASSVPIMLVDFAILIVVSLTMMFVGRRSPTTVALAGASMGSLCFNVAGQMVAAAPLAAMETVAPQAFGAGNPEGVGLAALRAALLAAAFLLPTAPLWIHAEALLRALGQPAAVAAYGAGYMRWLAPGLAPLVAFQIGRKFVYAQPVTRTGPLLAAAIGLAAHWPWLELLSATRLGVARGAPLALCCTYGTMAGVLVAHTRCRVPRAVDAWPRHAHTRRLLWADARGWRAFACTSLAALATLTEWLFWEVTAFRVGRLGATPFAAYSVAYSLEPALFMLPLGLSTGLSNAVGNLLGARRVAEAKRTAAIALGLGAGVVGCYAAAVAAVGPHLAALFSADAAVLAAAAAMWPSFCGFLMISGPFAMMLGLIRGLGLQRQLALGVVGILWPLGGGLVLGVAASPYDVWLCLIATYSTIVAVMGLLAGCSSWEALAERAIAAHGAKGGAEPPCSSATRKAGGLAGADGAAAAADGLGLEEIGEPSVEPSRA